VQPPTCTQSASQEDIMDTITREITVNAARTRVWEVVTGAEHLGRWFGDAGAEVDLRPGGRLTLSWQEHGTVLGRVERVEAPEVFSFRWARGMHIEPAPGEETLVEFTLTEAADGTLLRVVESGFEGLTGDGEAHRTGNVEGWKAELGELVTYLQSVPA
jgi:uncharacterized protein YndB with AHSA1/START domain